MKKTLKILFKVLKITFGILLILYIVTYAYVSFNKASIIKQVTDAVGKKLNGKVSIGNVELSFFSQFPKVAVQLNNVSITDSMFSHHKHPFFQAERLFARLSIVRLIKNQAPLNGIKIENGGIYMYTDSTGYTNTYLFKRKEDSTTAQPANDESKNELKSIVLKDVSFIIDDQQKEKLHNYFVKDLTTKLDENDTSFFIDVDAEILMHSMAFNVPRGSYFKEKKFTGKFDLLFNKQLNLLQFDNIKIKLSGQPFNLSGRFELKGDDPQFSLGGHARNIIYNEGKSMVTPRLDSSLSLVDFDKPLDVDVNIAGPLNGGEPLIYINWTVKGSHLKTPFLDFDNASFTGYFTNEYVKGQPRIDPNSIISNVNFSAEWRGLPVKARNIEILNLTEPVLTCDLLSEFPLTKLNEVIGSSFLQLQSGSGSVNLTYRGPIIRNNNTNSFINGLVSFKDGTILYAPRDVSMKNVSGQLVFKNSDVLIKDLRCLVLNNKILMQGHAKNLLTLINTEPEKANIDWAISTPSLNLGALTFLLKPGKNVVVSPGSKNKMTSAASNIDAVLEKAVLHVNLDARGLIYRKFEASNVNADISLLANKYVINNVSMNHAGGSIRMNGALLHQQANQLLANLNASMQDVDVSKVLSAFDNFGQDAILSQNLQGELTANIDASLGLNEAGEVLPSSVKSTIDFSLKDGALINYEPVKKMQNFLFKNRDFDNIRFAELKDRLEVENGEIKINRMEIQSSVFSFFVEGVYSTKGKTDINVQVPLSNLKKRGIDYNPENVGTDAKVKNSIYLRGTTGSDGNVNFKLDLFKRFRKKDKVIDTIEEER